MDEHAFPPTGFAVANWLGSAVVTFGGSGGMMTTARTELHYPCSPQAKTRKRAKTRGRVFSEGEVLPIAK